MALLNDANQVVSPHAVAAENRYSSMLSASHFITHSSFIHISTAFLQRNISCAQE